MHNNSLFVFSINGSQLNTEDEVKKKLAETMFNAEEDIKRAQIGNYEVAEDD